MKFFTFLVLSAVVAASVATAAFFFPDGPIVQWLDQPPVRVSMTALVFVTLVNIFILIFEHTYDPSVKRLTRRTMTAVLGLGVTITTYCAVRGQLDRLEILGEIRQARAAKDVQDETRLRVVLHASDDHTRMDCLTAFALTVASAGMFLYYYRQAGLDEAAALSDRLMLERMLEKYADQ